MFRASVVTFVTLGLATALACGKSGGTSAPPVSADGGTCLDTSCRSDDHCAGCTGGRTFCDSTQRRCVACGAGGGQCPSGQYCTQFGDCVPNGVTCNVDAKGNPTVSCNGPSDCAACDPKHQICDTALHQCVGCTAGDASKCGPNEVCIQSKCAPKCPSTCAADVDCGQCGAPGFEAHACNNGKCAACSPRNPCPGGARCTAKGVCEKACGIAGKARGTCQSDADCTGCEAGAVSCHLPINGGDGHCGPKAPGCDQLGPNLTLPDPWNKVTNLCSNDPDCAGVSVDFNVGKALRDVTGISSINDATVPYGMKACASVQILPDKACGVCAPCRKDSDCAPINVDQVSAQAFGPLGAVASTLLIEQVFGSHDHNINMYCEVVSGDYGYCRPCPNVFSACGADAPPPPTCDHGECTVGAALTSTCNSCTGEVCANDPFCCDAQNGSWDSSCVDAVGRLCAAPCP